MIVPANWDLPQAIRLRLGQTTYGRQRAIVEEGHLLLVLHQPPQAVDTRRDGVLFWRNAEGQWQVSRGGAGAAALKRHLQTYQELDNKLTQTYEQATDIKTLFEVLETLTPLARAARNMHQALQMARDAIKDDPFLIGMRDIGYEVDRDLELLLADVCNAIQYRMARETEEQSQLSKQALSASHRLNILAALFFPLTAIASVFGMNLAHGLDNGGPLLFWLVFALGAGLGVAATLWTLAGKQREQR